jgi:thioredoxin 1
MNSDAVIFTGAGPAKDYASTEPSRAAIDAVSGPLLIEFGAPWCGFCQIMQPLLDKAFVAVGNPVQHLKIEDGKGRPLGRSFGIKMWPTLVFMRNGEELARLIRPREARVIEEALRGLQTAPISGADRLAAR